MKIASLLPSRALALGESRCRRAKISAPEIFFWQSPITAVVIGLAQIPEREICIENLRADNLPLYRRHSGGGAVLLANQKITTLNFEIFTPTANDNAPSIRESFAQFLSPIRAAISAIIQAPVAQRGISDLTVNDRQRGEERKFCGVAQMRKREIILTHGTILIAGDLAQLARYLTFPSVSPDYRGKREHRDFCITLSEFAGQDISAAATAAVIAQTANNYGWRVIEHLPDDAESEKLLAEKYENPDWNWRRKNPLRR